VNVPTLIIPGIGNSDHVHWQTLWESANPEFVRVQQRDWNTPVCHEWVNVLEQTAAETVRPGSGCAQPGVSLCCTLGDTYEPQDQRVLAGGATQSGWRRISLRGHRLFSGASRFVWVSQHRGSWKPPIFFREQIPFCGTLYGRTHI
jgi:hypothetical protein